VTYKIGNPAHDKNTSRVEFNVYLSCLESTIRFDIRYAQCLTYLEKKHDMAKRVLEDALKLSARTMHISPALKFYIHFLLGYANQQIFYEKCILYQS